MGFQNEVDLVKVAITALICLGVLVILECCWLARSARKHARRVQDRKNSIARLNANYLCPKIEELLRNANANGAKNELVGGG